MTDVAVLGLGNMGAALARAFLAKGHATAVWNRTPAKAQALAELGARVSPDAASAIRVAPISLVCVERYDQVRALLEEADAAGALAGSAIVNVTWGSPEEARDMETWVADRGAQYLDSDIYDYPDAIGNDIPVVPYAGGRAVYDRFADLLSALGPAHYHGPDPAVPNILGSAVAAYHHVAAAAFFEAAAYADGYGVSPREFLEFNALVGQPLTERAVRRGVAEIEDGDFRAGQASLHAHYDAAIVNRDDRRRIGQPAPMLAAFCDLVEPLLANQGDLELAAIFQPLRAER
ncbi:NAD(P)-dependent oxidoreductase [Nocardioides aromaticivorans]|nr:NAD(P)-binding domain-containing protein [Nocardioides aromaticivorans]